MSTQPKVVKIKENELVDLIENIVNNTIAEKKKEWISEQKAKSTKVLEETIAKIVAKQLKTK